MNKKVEGGTVQRNDYGSGDSRLREDVGIESGPDHSRGQEMGKSGSPSPS